MPPAMLFLPHDASSFPDWYHRRGPSSLAPSRIIPILGHPEATRSCTARAPGTGHVCLHPKTAFSRLPPVHRADLKVRWSIYSFAEPSGNARYAPGRCVSRRWTSQLRAILPFAAHAHDELLFFEFCVPSPQVWPRRATVMPDLSGLLCCTHTEDEHPPTMRKSLVMLYRHCRRGLQLGISP